MKPRKYTPSKRVRNHIAKWEASDFAGLNAAFGGDAVGAKAVELMNMLGDKANAFTDNELDGLLSTYYNLSPKGFRKTLMPYIDAYVADLSDATRMKLDQAMRNRWTIAALKYQKGIKRRAAADTALTGLTRSNPQILEYKTKDGNKVMKFDYGQPFQPQPLPKPIPETQYPLSGSQAPESLSSWNAALSPSATPTIPSIQKLNNERNAAVQGAFLLPEVTVLGNRRTSLLPKMPSLNDALMAYSPLNLMNRAVSDMLGLNDLWEDFDVTSDLFKAKNGKLPRYNTGLVPGLTEERSDNTRVARQEVHLPVKRQLLKKLVTTELMLLATENKPVVKLDNYTRKRVAEESNKRTWRSDVADVLHNFGEGAALAATFAAPEVEPLVYPAYQAAKAAVQLTTKLYIAPRLVSTLMKPLMQYMAPVMNRFRNQEWSNFLQTVNGDNYYRIARDASLVDPGEKYFVSHTTPWLEFTNFGEMNSGANRLYEFPTRTFGKLNSTTDKGVRTTWDVTEMGKKHLLYGDAASGPRDYVRILRDKDAQFLNMSPYKIGLTERPLNLNGMYDARPIYNDIFMGNQTTVKGRTLNDAILNSPHNEYYPVEGGILKVLHVSNDPLRNYGVRPNWKNPIDNALSIELLDGMLGEYLGKGAERMVFEDRRFPGRVVKIGGGVNGEEKIYNFDLLRDAVEYSMEMNNLPGVAPLSYEGFIDEGGLLIPWFSQPRVIPAKKIADPFLVFSKKPILPNGKTATGKLSAIRYVDREKAFGKLGYKPAPNNNAWFSVDGYPYRVGDLGQKNIGFDQFGNIKIFDPLIEL